MNIASVLEFARPFFTKFVIAIVIILFGFIIGKVAGKLLQRFLHEIELNNFIKKNIKIKIALEEFLAGFVSYAIYFIAVIMALRQAGLATDVLNILGGAIMVIIILSIFLGIKDFVPNFMAGLSIHKRRFIKEGDKIQVSGVKGKVILVSLVETRIETSSGNLIYIPNSLLVKSEIIKFKN